MQASRGACGHRYIIKQLTPPGGVTVYSSQRLLTILLHERELVSGLLFSP